MRSQRAAGAGAGGWHGAQAARRWSAARGGAAALPPGGAARWAEPGGEAGRRVTAWPQRPLAASGALARGRLKVPHPTPESPETAAIRPQAKSPVCIFKRGQKVPAAVTHTALQRGWTFPFLRFYFLNSGTQMQNPTFQCDPCPHRTLL